MAATEIDGDQFQSAFGKLDAQRAILTNCTLLWKDLSHHFSSLEGDLLQKSKDLDSKLESLDSKAKETLESLVQREQSIPAKEEEALARIDRQKEAALSEIEKDAENSATDKELPAVLRTFCWKMDFRGLWRFLVSKRKDIAALRTEISPALTESIDPVKLVLQVVEDFVFQRSGKVGVSDQRWACGMLLRALLPALGVPEYGGYLPEASCSRVLFAGSVLERVRAVADTWKSRIDEIGEVKNANPADVQTFLQHLATFGIASRFDEEYLRKLVVAFAFRRDMPKLAVSLGLKDKMGDIIEELVNSGKELDAIYFAYESGLTEKFPPLFLLKTHLKNLRKHVYSIAKKGGLAAQDEANTSELNSLKAIIKCVEEHKLESEFTLESLKKRVAVLEKAKADRKKAAGPVKSQNKRSRASGGGGAVAAFPPAKAGRITNAYASVRQDQGPSSYPAPYSYPTQGGYNVGPNPPAPGAYASQYAGAVSRSPAALSQNYAYLPAEDMGGLRAGGPTYVGAATYGAGYEYGSGVAQPYQSTYMH